VVAAGSDGTLPASEFDAALHATDVSVKWLYAQPSLEMGPDGRRSGRVALLLLVVAVGAAVSPTGVAGQPTSGFPSAGLADHTPDPTGTATSDPDVRLNLTATPSGDVRLTVRNAASEPLDGLAVTIRITEGRPTTVGSADVPTGTTLSTADWPTPRNDTTPVRLVWTLDTLDQNASRTLSVADVAEPRLSTAGSVARLAFEATATVGTDATGERQRVGSDRTTAERERDPFYVDAPPSPTPTPTPSPEPTHATTDRATSTTTPGFGAGAVVLAAVVALVARRLTRSGE
jgi:hypothetical protein